jgi:hypothetical protein
VCEQFIFTVFPSCESTIGWCRGGSQVGRWMTKDLVESELHIEEASELQEYDTLRLKKN